MNQLVRGAVALSLVSAATLGAQAAAPRDTIITAPTRAPRTPLPSEAASAKIKKFSFIAYGDTRGRFDGTALQVEHGKVVESMLGTIKQVAGTGDAIRFVVQSGDAVFTGTTSVSAPSGNATLLMGTAQGGKLTAKGAEVSVGPTVMGTNDATLVSGDLGLTGPTITVSAKQRAEVSNNR